MANIYNSQLDAFDLYHLVQEPTESSSSLTESLALPALGHAVTGSLGSAVSNVTTYPLALIATKLQVQKHTVDVDTEQVRLKKGSSVADIARTIYAERGLQGLFAGLEADSVKTVADAFLFFLSYNYLRQARLRRNIGAKNLSVLDQLAIGFCAGAFSKFLTTPINNIVTRKQTSTTANENGGRAQNSDDAAYIAKEIYHEKGAIGFWSGYSASIILTLNPTFTFFFFEFLKRFSHSERGSSHTSARAVFFFAAVSKALASTITYPFSLAKTRLQVDKSTKSQTRPESSANSSPNLLKVISDIVKHEGYRGLYEGLSAEIMKGFFTHGMTMLTKSSIHRFIIGLYFMVAKLLNRSRFHRLIARGR